MADSSSKNTLYCSFCGKSQHEVRKLIAGPVVFICDECVGICLEIVGREALFSEDIAVYFALKEMKAECASEPSGSDMLRRAIGIEIPQKHKHAHITAAELLKRLAGVVPDQLAMSAAQIGNEIARLEQELDRNSRKLSDEIAKLRAKQDAARAVVSKFPPREKTTTNGASGEAAAPDAVAPESPQQ